MQKYWDVIAVGALTFVVTAIILMVKPGYMPVEVSDEVQMPPASVEETIEEEEADAPVEVEAEETAEATEDASDAARERRHRRR